MATTVPKEELRAIFATLAELPIELVIWDGEPVPAATPTEDGRAGRLVLNVVATRRLGEDEEIREYPTPDTTRLTYRGFRVRTISVRAEQFDGDEGFDVLESVRLGIGQNDTRELLNAAGLSLASSEDVRTVDAAAGNRAVSFATFDVLLNQTVSKVVTKNEAGYIESAKTVGAGDLVIAGTDVVDGSGS